MQAEYIKIATYHTCQVSQRETYRDVKTKASENTILPKLFSPDVPLEKTHWLQMSSSVNWHREISWCRRGEHTCRIFPLLTQPFNILLLYSPAVAPDWLSCCTVMYDLAFNWIEAIYEACPALFLFALAHFLTLTLSHTQMIAELCNIRWRGWMKWGRICKKGIWTQGERTHLTYLL